MSGETLEVEVNELMRGLQDIQKDIDEFASAEEIAGDRFKEVMTVSFQVQTSVVVWPWIAQI